jgi:hypothetical protein
MRLALNLNLGSRGDESRLLSNAGPAAGIREAMLLAGRGPLEPGRLARTLASEIWTVLRPDGDEGGALAKAFVTPDGAGTVFLAALQLQEQAPSEVERAAT